MAREKVEFDVIGRDVGGSKAFREVGDAAGKAADKIEDAGKASVVAGEAVEQLGDKTERAGEQADETGDEYRGLAADIAQAQVAMAALAREIDRTGNLDLVKDLDRQRRELRKLTRVQDLLPDASEMGVQVAEKASVSFAARFGPLLTKVPLGPVGGVIGATLGVALVPALGAAVQGAVVGGVGAGGVIGGVALAARDARVQAAGKSLGQQIMGDLDSAAGDWFVQPTLAGIGEIQDAWGDVSGDVDAIFEATSRYVQPLARGIGDAVREIAPDLREAAEAAEPIIREVGEGLPRIADALGDMMSDFADNADEGASALRFIFQITETGIRTVGGLVDVLGDVYRVVLDVGDAAGTTADLLWGWVPGAGDKIDEGRARIAELKGALEGAGDAGATGGERAAGGIRKVEEAATEAVPEVQTFAHWLDESLGRALTEEEANLRLEESILRVGQAAKTGADEGIKPNTEAGAANRKALLDLAAQANSTAATILENTGSHELAAEATEKGRKAFLEAADAMGVEQGEAIALANKLFGIPEEVKSKAEVDTKAALAKLQTYNEWLSTVDRDVYNRIITETVTRRSARGGHQEFSLGGYVDGPGPKGIDSVPAVLAPGEGVLTAREVDALGGPAGFAQMRAALRAGQAPVGAASAPAPAGSGRAGGYEQVLASLIGDELRRALRDMPLVRVDAGRAANVYTRTG